MPQCKSFAAHVRVAWLTGSLLTIVACGSAENGGPGSIASAGSATAGGSPASAGSATAAAGAPAVVGSGGSPFTNGGSGNSNGGSPSFGGSTQSAGGSTQSAGGATSTGSAGAAGTSGGAASTAGTSAGGAPSGGATGTGTSPGGGKPCDIWVAPDGNDASPGSAAAPVKTPQHAYDLICPGTAGAVNGALCSGTYTTMCLKAGTYNLSTRIEFKKTRMGTPTRIITMMADPAATTKPILNFASQPRLACGDNPVDKNIYGIDMGADWYRVKGLEVAGANDSGILVQGAHQFVENCAVHDSEDTGVLVNSSSGYINSGTYATILNVDSYHNHDERCQGANADGFGVKKGSGEGNVFDGCRAWDNSDDGWDFFAWSSPVTVKNSWAFNQGGTTAGAQSNGNGFKLGGDGVSAKHIISSLFAFDNRLASGHKADWGFTNNSNPASMTCTGCGAWNNLGGQFQNIGHTGDVNATSVTAAKAMAAKRNADGSLPDIAKL